MKCLALLLLSLAMLPAADFATNQAARAVIGQENFTRQQPGASDKLLGAVSGLAYANNTLFVVDGNRVNAQPQNNRVLIFPNINGQIPALDESLPAGDGRRCPVCLATASVVLGQRNFELGGMNGTTGTGKDQDGKEVPVGEVRAISAQGFRTPTAVATDGQRLAVADTDNNRVLIWNQIPTDINVPADVVVGQEGFNRNRLNLGGSARTPSKRGLRGPQGVWFHNGALLVADTQNHRVLIWNSVPASNGAEADLVLGQPNFTTYVEPDIAQTRIEASATNMLNPVSVTTDVNGRVYVADLGHNRVLIWNSFPTQIDQAADIALGQPDMTSAIANNSPALCESNGTDAENKPTYPARCAATLNFPRYALSDGQRLFVADSGNDRVLVYGRIPTDPGARADVILGQRSEFEVYQSEIDFFGGTSELNPDMVGTNALRTPMSLAWDGTNLYVSDPYNRRVLVFSPAERAIADAGIRNLASQEIYAVGTVTFTGKIKEGDEVTLKIADKEYKYKIIKDDTFANVVTSFVGLINAGEGDPNVYATSNVGFQTVILTARKAGEEGNAIAYSAAVKGTADNTAAEIAATAGSSSLAGGQSTAKLAPGTLITIRGENFTDREYTLPEGEPSRMELGGVELYVDGIRTPLFYASPTQLNAQLPFTITDTTGVTLWVRTAGADGVRVSRPVAVSVVPQNPGIFAEAAAVDPRPAMAFHESSYATGAISIDGAIKENDVATITIGDGDAARSYTYTVLKDDTLAKVRDTLVERINEDPQVRAEASGQYTRIRLFAREPGAPGEGLKYGGKGNDGGSLVITPLGSGALCCANVAGAQVTEQNPAKPGQTIVIYASGLGPVIPDEAAAAAIAGQPYTGPEVNRTNSPVSDAIAGGKTANVLFAGLAKDTACPATAQPVCSMPGVYKVVLQLNSDLPTNPQTQMTIAQDVYVSNIVTFAVKNPADDEPPQ